MGGAGFFIILAQFFHERRFAVLAQQAARYRHGARGVEDVDDGLTVMLRNLHRRVRLARGRAADEQRNLETSALHLARDVNHLVQRRRDQTAQADDVGIFRFRAFQDFFARHHHAEVNHLVVVAGQHHTDDVLADVMHVAFDGGEHDFSLRLHDFAARNHRGLLGFHERRKIRDGLFHHARGLHDLRQKHLARAEQIADDAHAGHQGAFDDGQRLAIFRECFGCVRVNISINAFHQRVRQTFFNRAFAPFFFDLFVGRGCARTGGFEFFAMHDKSFRCVRTAIKQNVFDEFLQLRLNLLIDFQHAGVDDAHVHARFDRVIEKRAVHRLAHGIVTAKAE